MIPDDVFIALVLVTMAAFTGGVVIVARRYGSRKCGECGKRFHTLWVWARQQDCPECRAEARKATARSAEQVLAGVLLLGAWFGAHLVFGLWNRAALTPILAVDLALLGICLVRGKRKPSAVGLGLFVVGGGLILAHLGCVLWDAPPPNELVWMEAVVVGVSLLTRRGRRAWARLFRGCRTLSYWLIRAPQKVDYAAARRASGGPGRVFAEGMVSGWTDAACDLEAELESTIERTLGEFESLTGLPGRMGRPVRFLCFESESALAAYSRVAYGRLGRLTGYYEGFGRQRIAVCRELADRMPSTLRSVIAHELTHHLTRSNSVRFRWVWLIEGLAVAVARRVSPESRAPGAASRHFRAADAREELLLGGKLFKLTFADLHERLKDWGKAEDAAFVGAIYGQSGAFVTFLSEIREEGLKRFLRKLPRTRRSRVLFHKCFGLTAEEAMARWADDMRGAEVPPHEAPPDALKERIEKELVVPIRDGQVPDDERRLAIRYMGAGGWAWGAVALVEVLENADDPMRAEAQRALENIAGEVRGESPEPWREWLASLQGEVVGRR